MTLTVIKKGANKPRVLSDRTAVKTLVSKHNGKSQVVKKQITYDPKDRMCT